MADQYTEVTHTGFLGNMLNSLVGVLLGVLLFFGSFAVLWINEGRVNLATIARKSTPLVAATVAPAADGKLVAASGTLATTETLGDPGYIRPDRYLALERSVEMYAWVEHRHTSTKKNSGGSSTTTTSYTYQREWTAHPESASSFRQAAGHENPELPLKSASWRVRSATLGAYSVDPQPLTLPDALPLTLNAATIQEDGRWPVSGRYLLSRVGSLDQPKVGDLRISYGVVPGSLDVTLFGKASGSQIVPFEAQGARLYRAFAESREQAIATLNTEYLRWLWLLRLGGFLMMWIGMSICFSPINAALDILPVLGGISRFLIGAIMFGVALLLSTLTILAAIVAHNIVLLLVLLIVVGGGALLWGRARRPRPVAVAT